MNEPESLYKTLFENALDAMFVMKEGHFIDCNGAALKFLGGKRDDIVGRTFSDLIPASESSKDIEVKIRRALHGEDRIFDLRLKKFDGRIFDAEAAFCTVELAGGRHVLIVIRDITERKQAEKRDAESLRESRQTYLDIFNATNDAIFLHDVETGEILDINERALEMFGATHGEILTRDLGAGSLDEEPYTGVHAREKIHKAVSEGPQLFEWRSKRWDGALLWTEVSLRSTTIAGKPRVLAAVRDITDRKLADERLEQIFEAAPVGLALLNNRFVKKVNKRWCETFGYEPEEVVGEKTCRFFMSDEQYEFVGRDRYRQYEEKGRASWELELRRKDGRIIDVFIEYVPVNPNDIYGDYIVSMVDVTDRKRAEETLRTIFKAAPVGIALLNDRVINEVNDRACEIFGYLPKEVIGERTRIFFLSDEQYEDLRKDRDRQFRERGNASAELKLKKKDGTLIDIFAEGALLNPKDLSGDYIVSVLDITDRKRAEEALKEADKRKDEFLAMLGHELRNPMAAIMAALTLIERPEAKPESVRMAKDVLRKRVTQLVQVVDDLLDVSRISRGKIKLEKENIDLKTVLESAVESAKWFLHESGQTIDVQIDEPLIVFGDPARLQQIFVNIINNAIRFSDKGQRTFLHAFREDRFAVVRVKDQGIGISPEFMPKIFEPFAQSERSLARSRGGLGMGLAIVKQLSEMHWGSVSARSGGEGKGSEFEVRLPLGAEYHVSPKPEATRTPKRHSLRILLVEDNPDTANLESEVLSAEGYSVDVAYDGVTAVEKALAAKPEVILLDIGLPGLSGYEVAERIRSAGLTDTYIVAVTGYAQESDVNKGREAGMDVHIKKPVEHETLCDLLDRWAEERKP